MSSDSSLIVFTSLRFAAVFLALVIGMAGRDMGEIIADVAAMRPSMRKQAKFDQLDYMTRVANDAIEARRLGKRNVPGQMDF